MAELSLEKLNDQLKKMEKKMVTKEELDSLMELIMKIQKSEDEIREGKIVKANTSMSDEEIDDLLTA